MARVDPWTMGAIGLASGPPNQAPGQHLRALLEPLQPARYAFDPSGRRGGGLADRVCPRLLPAPRLKASSPRGAR